MTRSGLGYLEWFWRKASFTSPLRVPVCQIHHQKIKKKTFVTLLSQQNHAPNLTTSCCRHSSSHIVKSPYKDIDIPDKLVPEMVWETVDRFPDSVAVKCGLTGRSYTLAEIQQLSCRFANSLRQAGLHKGETVALVLPNCPEFAIIVLGVLEAELTITFINHHFTADEMCHQLKDSGSVCVVAAPDSLDVVISAVTKVEDKTHSKPIRRIIAMDIPSPESLPQGVGRLSEMIASHIDSTAKVTKSTLPTELAFLPYSSGTSGLPKGVCLSQRNVIANILQVASIDMLRFKSPEDNQDVVLGILPFFHAYGLIVCLLSSLIHASQVVTLPKFDPDTFINLLNNEKLTVAQLVPPLVLFLSLSNRVLPKHLANLRVIGSGAAPLGATDMDRLVMKMPQGKNCLIMQAFGMTELSPVATAPTVPVKNTATIGVPLPNTFAKIINTKTGESLGCHEHGEICIKGPQVMLGYHNNPKATSETIDSEGWLRTGDVGYYEEDGHFYIKDRLKELIKVKGFQVAPAELEEVLRTHPSVTDAGVIGVPSARSGETPVAYVVPKDENLTANEIIKFLSEKLSQHKQVSEVIFINSIPKSAAGKILRKELRQLYKNDHP